MKAFDLSRNSTFKQQMNCELANLDRWISAASSWNSSKPSAEIGNNVQPRQLCPVNSGQKLGESKLWCLRWFQPTCNVDVVQRVKFKLFKRCEFLSHIVFPRIRGFLSRVHRNPHDVKAWCMEWAVCIALIDDRIEYPFEARSWLLWRTLLSVR